MIHGEAASFIGCACAAIVLVALVVVLFSRCSTGTHTVPEKPLPRDPVMEANDEAIEARVEAERVLRASLKDGTSAKLDGLFVSRLSNGALALCGKVNAKNGFGAYTGYKSFIAPRNDEAPVLIEDNDIGFGDRVSRTIFREAYARFCGASVYQF